MKKLNWLVIKSYIGPFFMAFTVILFILVMQFLSFYMDEIFGKGLSPGVILQLFSYAAARLVVTAMPVAVLAGALISFGTMGENYELAAIKSSGISLFKIMIPMVMVGIGLMIFSHVFAFWIIPDANLKFFSLLYDVQRKKAEVAIKPGYFYSDIDGYVIRISDKDEESGTLYDVMLYDHTDRGDRVQLVLADSSRMKMEYGGLQMSMVLYHGSRHEELKPEPGSPNTYPYGRTYFDSLNYKFRLKGFGLERTDENLFARHQITQPRERLKIAVDSLRLQDSVTQKRFNNYLVPYNRIDTNFVSGYKDTLDLTKRKIKSEIGADNRVIDLFEGYNTVEILNKALSNARAVQNYADFIINRKKDDKKMLQRYETEFYMMHSIPVTCVIFMLIGCSLGAIIRKGGLGLPSLISILFFVFFYVLMQQGKKFAKEGLLSTFTGSWLPVIVLTPIAILLTWQATMDSKLLDESSREMMRDRIVNFFRKLMFWKKKEA